MSSKDKKRDVLGKGLEVLLSSASRESGQDIVELNINDIEPNRGQPRRIFNTESIKTLSDSIREHGVIQPIIVRKDGEVYRIVAGERRWRAARIAKLETIPARIWELSDRQSLEIALVENVQRQDLNPIEEAEAYEKLSDNHGLTQDQIAKAVGKSRPAVTNALRLLELDEEVKRLLTEEQLSSGHARALLSLADKNMQRAAALKVTSTGMSVRDVERLVKRMQEKDKKKEEPPVQKDETREECLREVKERLERALGTKVRIEDESSKGRIVISYFSNDELERLISQLTRK